MHTSFTAISHASFSEGDLVSVDSGEEFLRDGHFDRGDREEMRMEGQEEEQKSRVSALWLKVHYDLPSLSFSLSLYAFTGSIYVSWKLGSR